MSSPHAQVTVPTEFQASAMQTVSGRKGAVTQLGREGWSADREAETLRECDLGSWY